MEDIPVFPQPNGKLRLEELNTTLASTKPGKQGCQLAYERAWEVRRGGGERRSQKA